MWEEDVKGRFDGKVMRLAFDAITVLCLFPDFAQTASALPTNIN